MKRIVVFVAAVCIIVISCKKNSDSGGNASKIVGNWTPVHEYALTTSNGLAENDTFYFEASSYYDVRPDGLIYASYVDGNNTQTYDTSSYTVKDNLLITTRKSNSYTDTVYIMSLDEHALVTQYSLTAAGTTINSTTTYKK